MSEQPTHLCIVLAASAEDYADWCRATGRTPFTSTAWALSEDTGAVVTRRRTFHVTDRWREDPRNRKILERLGKDTPFSPPVPYGDEHGPWPDDRVPDLTWPTRTLWQRILGREAWRP